jgi:hypothetical protein
LNGKELINPSLLKDQYMGQTSAAQAAHFAALYCLF